ncbi:MAG: 30S ribosomal protein S9 [Flavobacteriales bacterium]
MSVIHKIGRRKTAVARLFLAAGKGHITINDRDCKDYFPTGVLQYKVQQPFILTDTRGKYDVKVSVKGGGYTGQVEAVRLAIVRALVALDESHRETVKPEGLLTRDPRMVERKRYGQKKARKNFQFSKR